MNKGRKIALPLVFLMIASLAIFLYMRKAAPPPSGIINHPSANQGVVAFGDSLVFGSGSTKGGGFVRMLSAELGVPIVNLGRSGDTTAAALRRVDEVKVLKPAVAIILLGGNDFLLGVPQEETFANLSRIIEEVQASGAAVLLVGIEALTPRNTQGERFQELSHRHRTAYVPDILRGILGSPTYMNDDIHPNDLGYDLMADRIKPILQGLLGSE